MEEIGDGVAGWWFGTEKSRWELKGKERKGGEDKQEIASTCSDLIGFRLGASKEKLSNFRRLSRRPRRERRACKERESFKKMRKDKNESVRWEGEK